MITATGFAQKTSFQSVANDPLKAQIYTLENGLTVYLSVNKEEPRIQTVIGVRVGSKDDPSNTTGLAHYFEHMMFKGTPNFGTTDWEKEKVMIQQIEDLFEVYRKTTDPEQRKKLYKEIDDLSIEASKLAIPNEYDKLMKAIGSTGTNAATGNDYTYYVENIPNNQLENWAKIQFDRFTYPVLRLFHTELETVYEEKNMSLTNDARRASEAMLNALFPNHPYGTQTTLGDPEHLKNPSMLEIRKFFDKYYVANNLAVSMSGDFDPEVVIEILKKTLGKLKPGNAPKFQGQPLPALTGVKSVDVIGLEAENVRIAYRLPGLGSPEAMRAELAAEILSNSKAGLLDLNVNQKQRIQGGAGASTWTLNDHCAMMISGRNKAGQTLEEVKDILLEQIELLKKGQFEDWLIDACINNIKLSEIRQLESNRSRSMKMVMAYLNRQNWEDVVSYTDRMSKITKTELVAFANQYFGNDYVVIYKRQGKPSDIPVVDKPAITPIHINRDAQSNFYKEVASAKVNKISPVFVDFDKEITKGKTNKGQAILYKKNETNPTFDLVYYFPFGSNEDKKINLAASYLNYLGTSKYTPEQIKQEFFKLACNFSVSASQDQTTIRVNGLSENQEKAMVLLESILKDAQPDEKAYQNLVATILKSRADSKKNQRSNFAALVDYATYGPVSPTTFTVSEAELKGMTPNDLIAIIKNMSNYVHDVIYYGPSSFTQIKALVEKHHQVPAKFTPAPKGVKFEVQDTKTDRVFFAHYDGPQSNVLTVSKGAMYDEKIMPSVNLYNAYFGGGMNAIVFQEMREKRGLAYSANARYNSPGKPDEHFRNTSFIATQNDKVVDALNAFNELFNEMPVSENAFNLAKEALITDIETNRISNMNIIWNYIAAKRMGRNYDFRKMMYEKVPSMTMQDVLKFNNQYIKNQPKTYVILGNEKLLDIDTIEKNFGKITRLQPETYFGY